MKKTTDNVETLSEAIKKLEGLGQSKSQEWKESLESDYNELRRTLDQLAPHLESLKGRLENEAKGAKAQVENQVKDNPWVALGIVGLLAFVLGWIFGQSRKD